MRRHRRETTTSCPHRTTPPLVNRERCTRDAKLDGSRMESSAGWRWIAGKFNCAAPGFGLFAPFLRVVALTRPYSALALSHRNLNQASTFHLSSYYSTKIFFSLDSVLPWWCSASLHDQPSGTCAYLVRYLSIFSPPTILKPGKDNIKYLLSPEGEYLILMPQTEQSKNDG